MVELNGLLDLEVVGLVLFVCFDHFWLLIHERVLVPSWALRLVGEASSVVLNVLLYLCR